ncbi:hypothetical protein E0L36_11390 [Streptomyces sp. AJS327]|uniref:hypothetical protein n=1 Tax=Streptomyces sp. AJS327 TaxID=2545265 RepID=UPI0015DFF0FC|nr:hypothetical protein [Streptomyces sp. AJS327]MBA0051473.1 hypothetical protein [Streptomyces sp. AJS327]
MINIKTAMKMTDRSVICACLLGSNHGTGLSGVMLGGAERPTKALAVAAETAQVRAYAFASAIAGAGAESQRTQRRMWAFRGLEPWREPA